MRINILFLLALATGSCAAQQYGDRIGRQNNNKQNNGYFYPEPSPPFRLPQSTTTTTTTTTTPPPPPPRQDYLPPAYVECSLPKECVSIQVCNSRRAGQSDSPSTDQCLIGPGGQTGVCCAPAPRTTTTTTTTTTTQRTTTLSLEYLPPPTPGYAYPVPEEPLQYPDSNNEKPVIVTVKPPTQPSIVEEDEIPLWDFRESIPGDPETDYPILAKIPETSFSCDGKVDGFYADMETRCQVFHVCASMPEGPSTRNSFLCPNGTIFHQESFVCQWWADVDCKLSPQYFALNKNIGKVPETSPYKSVVGVRSVSSSARGHSQPGSRPSLSHVASETLLTRS